MPKGNSADADIDANASLRNVHDHDLNLLNKLEPEIAQWWVHEFSALLPENGGLLTPPQREAIPHIQAGHHSLICAPTGSGKCVDPSTPILIDTPHGSAVIPARNLLDHTSTHVASVDGGGDLYSGSLSAVSIDVNDKNQENLPAFVYRESYTGELWRLRTDAGHDLKCTQDHPVLVETTSGPKWRSVGTLEPGDRIGVPSYIDLPERRIRVGIESALAALNDIPDGVVPPFSIDRISIEESDGKQKYVFHGPICENGRFRASFPAIVEESLARLTGYFIRDRLRCKRAPSEASRYDVSECIEVDFIGLPPNVKERTLRKRFIFGPIRLMIEAGLGIGGFASQVVPNWPLNLEINLKWELFRSLFSGYLEDNRWYLESESPLDCERLIYLSLSMGIQPTKKVLNDQSVAKYRLTFKDRVISDATVLQPASARTDGGFSSPIRWVTIREIGQYPYSGPIYDLSVPGLANYIGGAGAMYLHNTLASFTVIINELLRKGKSDTLENTVYGLYISPLKSLANDIHRNLEVPLSGVTSSETLDRTIDIRHAIRHGDTTDHERRGMLEDTPHILNTTPETLAILLNSPKFSEKLRTIGHVIVDEIHSLAGNKRGSHLAISLERLEDITDSSPVRIGCSATVEPLDTIGKFLVGREHADGPARPYKIVDTRFSRSYDLELTCPTDDLINTPAWEIQDIFYSQLHSDIQAYTNVLVFTNTRSGAERVLYNLRDRFPGVYHEDNSACHHGSLSKKQRSAVESGLKEGRFEVVTTSTSLELGIDMPHIDLVVQVGSPKSVSALLQRIGRAGHQLGRTVTGRIIALDLDDLVECTVMVRLAETGFVDGVTIPENASDVAAQHVYGMAINAIRPEQEIKSTIKRAFPYRGFSETKWESLIKYLTGGYDGLEERNIYPKIWWDENDPPDGDRHHPEFPAGEALIGRRGRLARPIYMTNIGTIPDSFTCQVFTSNSQEWVGDLDEAYLDTLDPGDVFILGGNRFEFRYRRGSKVYADRTSDRPTVPTWYSERLPLSYDLAIQIQQFNSSLLEQYDEGGPVLVRDWLRKFSIDENAVRAISRMYDSQIRFADPESVNTPNRIVIEEEQDRERYKRRYYVHALYGRKVNEGFARLLAHQSALSANATIQMAVADNGFTLVLPLNQKLDVKSVVERIDPSTVRPILRDCLRDTDLLQRYFRINATRSLLILKRYKGYEKTAGEQQFSSEMLLGFAEELDDFAVIEETYREILEDKFSVDSLIDILSDIRSNNITIHSHQVSTPSPIAYGLATLSTSEIVLIEEEQSAIKSYHEQVNDSIDGSSTD